MTENAPALIPSATELWQYAQAISTISSLAGRIREHLAKARERDGRLAFADDEHAARQHEARQWPALRLMTEAEQTTWQQTTTTPPAPSPEEPVQAWAAPMLNGHREPTGEWGLQAHTWDHGREASSLFAVCRDAQDALGLARNLRDHGTPDQLVNLRRAAQADGGSAGAGAVLSEEAWAAALRQALPPELAAAIVVTDPAHRHHAAWRELHALAEQEVHRVGADPHRLASLILRVPHWRDDVRNPPALAHWALTQARTTTSYRQSVAAVRGRDDDQARVQRLKSAEAAEGTPAPGAAIEPTALRQVGPVRSPEEAYAWAAQLQAGNAEHRVHAKMSFGRWGSRVDAVLVEKYPDLLPTTDRAAQAIRTRRDTRPQGADATALAELATEVDRLDPAKPIDRRAAQLMLGRVPVEIDRLLADKFAADPQFAEKLHTLYPEGLPEAEAATWRARATGDQHAAATALTKADDPTTPQREDAHGATEAARSQGLAAQHHGIAAAIAGERPPTVRRAEPLPAARRRT